MRTLFVTLGLLAVAGVAFAGSPPVIGTPSANSMPCNLQYVAYDWDFAGGNMGFTTTTCDATGGLPVWAHGACNIAGAPGDVWGTVLMGDYPSDSGEGVVSPAFTVGADAHLMEIFHYYDIETNYDGGNVSVDGTVITPMAGYDGTLSTSTSYYAFCVDLEDGFTGHANVWMTSCFDLAAYMGQTISVEFDFGSDSSVTYPGWYIASVKVGTDQVVPVEDTTWGSIKELYN
jgi:hypothetical protein